MTQKGKHIDTLTQKGKHIDTFISNRVVNYWNKIPDSIKQAESVDVFKARLENFKTDNREVKGNFWELSEEIFARTDEYDRTAYESFMLANPGVAKRKGINVDHVSVF